MTASFFKIQKKFQKEFQNDEEKREKDRHESRTTKDDSRKVYNTTIRKREKSDKLGLKGYKKRNNL